MGKRETGGRDRARHAATAKRRRGLVGEELAAEALRCRGWNIVARNWRIAGLEVDLLARDPAGTLVAVEVRRRRALGDAGPRELLGARKLAALRRQREVHSAIERVDLLFVLGPPGDERIRLCRGIA